jgi:hypothetical protein
MRHSAAHGPARRVTSWCSRVLLSVVGAVIGMTFLGAGAALAYWATTDSSHPAQAAAATLSVPTAGAQNGTATPSTVPIKWTAPTGYTSAGYTVLTLNLSFVIVDTGENSLTSDTYTTPSGPQF